MTGGGSGDGAHDEAPSSGTFGTSQAKLARVSCGAADVRTR